MILSPPSLQVCWYDDKVLFWESQLNFLVIFLLERLGSSEKSYVDDSHKTDALNLQVRKSIDYCDDTLYHAMLSIFFSPPGEKDEMGSACSIVRVHRPFFGDRFEKLVYKTFRKVDMKEGI